MSTERFRAGKRLWEPEEDQLLRDLFPHWPTPNVATHLRRTACAVYARAGILGLKKTAAYLASPDACRLRRGDNVGAPYRFKKGQVPPNKGLRRPGWGPGRMKATQFQKGQRSGTAGAHWMPIGSTRLLKDRKGRAYVLRKVSDVPNVPYTVNWKLEHRLIWTAANGPIPSGFALKFKNDNPLDVRLDNLELISRRDLMARNTVHNLPAELKASIHLLGQLKRRIRERGNDAEEHDRRSA